MKLRAILILIAAVFSNLASSQKVCNELYYKQYKKDELVADVDFIREKILNAHINPFSEISKEEFERNIDQIKNSLKDGMTQRDFYFLAKPILVKLNDEHSGLNDFCVTDSIKTNLKFLPLRFKLKDNKVILTENYSYENLEIGDRLLSINDISIDVIVNGCSDQAFGISDGRKNIAVDKLWLYLSKFCFFITDDYQLNFESGKSILINGQTWKELNSNIEKTKKQEESSPVLHYNKVKNFGYLSVSTFSDRKINYETWKGKFDSIFKKIRQDNIDSLIIDIRKNGGGNSAIGNLLIDYFSNESYLGYGGKWKKSQEYSDLMKKNKSTLEKYERLKNGEIMPISSKQIKPSINQNRFNGKTYILVGENTFSSAMMFAATVLDNNLATVVGQIPDKGHPNHFGELITFTTPNTDLYFRFGVKEWIRPSGVLENNFLVPNILMDLDDKSTEQIIQLLE